MLRGYAERLRKTENGLPLWTTAAIQDHRHGRLTNAHGVRKLSLRQALGFHQLPEPLGEFRFLLIHLVQNFSGFPVLQRRYRFGIGKIKSGQALLIGDREKNFGEERNRCRPLFRVQLAALSCLKRSMASARNSFIKIFLCLSQRANQGSQVRTTNRNADHQAALGLCDKEIPI